MESLPVAIEFLQQVFSSKRLIAPVSKQFQNYMEIIAVFNLISEYICKAYQSELSQDRIDELFREVLHKPSMMNPEIIRALINLIVFNCNSK